jgi:hypothetical protein
MELTFPSMADKHSGKHQALMLSALFMLATVGIAALSREKFLLDGLPLLHAKPAMRAIQDAPPAAAFHHVHLNVIDPSAAMRQGEEGQSGHFLPPAEKDFSASTMS